MHNEEWKSNGIDIHDISKYKGEKEILFLPFSFFLITKVNIEFVQKNAEIHLETIEKKDILEEAIKSGNRVKYNEDKKIMESVPEI